MYISCSGVVTLTETTRTHVRCSAYRSTTVVGALAINGRYIDCFAVAAESAAVSGERCTPRRRDITEPYSQG